MALGPTKATTMSKVQAGLMKRGNLLIDLVFE
jgi:hypothetical protein